MNGVRHVMGYRLPLTRRRLLRLRVHLRGRGMMNGVRRGMGYILPLTGETPLPPSPSQRERGKRERTGGSGIQGPVKAHRVQCRVGDRYSLKHGEHFGIIQRERYHSQLSIRSTVLSQSIVQKSERKSNRTFDDKQPSSIRYKQNLV